MTVCATTTITAPAATIVAIIADPRQHPASRVVEFEQDRLIAWRHLTPHRWRYELAPQTDETTTVTSRPW